MSDAVPPSEETVPDDEADRTTERRSFFLNTLVTLVGQPGVQARVRNLSAGGMMVELEQAPDPEWAPGDPLVAELRNIGRVKGVIAWAGGRRFGIQFDREIDPEQARTQANGPKDTTPDFIKPILVPQRSLKYVEGLQGR